MSDSMPVQPKKNNTVLIAVVVVVLLCCCCLAVVSLGWSFGDTLVEMLNF